MIIHIILSILSFLLSGTIFYFTGLYDKWYFYFIPVLSIPIIYVLLFGIYVVLLWIASLFMSTKKEIKKPNKLLYPIVRQTATQLLIFFNTKIHHTGLKQLPKERCLIISNHQSSFDPMIPLRYSKNHPLICVTKTGNIKIPIGGKWIYNAGFIPINRDNNFEGIKAITKATSYIKDDLASIFICPEGTRNREDELLEFHAGSFKIAYKAKAPIVITSIQNSKYIMKDFPFKRTHIYFDIIEVLNYEDYKDKTTQEIANYARTKIQQQLNERK